MTSNFEFQSLLLDAEGKQLLAESIYLFGVMLLLLGIELLRLFDGLYLSCSRF